LKRAPLQKRLRLLGVRVGALAKEDELPAASENIASPDNSSRRAAKEDLTGQLF
jgi:hypothetical protein